MQNASMSVQITIRDVPDDVRDELAARAALEGKSMQEFLRGELERIASSPSIAVWLAGVAERKSASGTRVSASAILRARDSGRR
jgi:plasmid stability protein